MGVKIFFPSGEPATCEVCGGDLEVLEDGYVVHVDEVLEADHPVDAS